MPQDDEMAAFVIALVHQENGAFGISFPDFPGCVSGGKSLDEVVSRGTRTLAFHLEGMIADDDPLPTPRTLNDLRADPVFVEDAKDAVIVAVPIELPGKPVRVNISIDDRLLEAVDRAASAAGQSRSAFLAMAAKERLKGAA